jgi:hypothetical protein
MKAAEKMIPKPGDFACFDEQKAMRAVQLGRII